MLRLLAESAGTNESHGSVVGRTLEFWGDRVFEAVSRRSAVTVDWEAFTDNTVESAEVRLLGMVDTASVLALQKLMVHEVRQQNRVCAAVLICEHPPSITIGENASLLDLPADQRALESRCLKTYRVNRTGGTFFHQPGQLAIYVVVSLDECGFDENELRRRLQNAIIETCQDSQVAAHRQEDDPHGVWGRHGLICEIGIGVDKGVTSFGAFLNVGGRIDEAKQFGRGLKGDRLSSLNAERVRPSIMPQVRSALIQALCEQIGYPEYHVHTGHPFLARSRHNVKIQDDD